MKMPSEVSMNSEKQTKKQAKPTNLKVGAEVTWKSTASNVKIQKKGAVLAFIGKGINWRSMLNSVPARLLKGIDLQSTYHRAGEAESQRDRYLVAVTVIGKTKLQKPLLYTPLATTINEQNGK